MQHSDYQNFDLKNTFKDISIEIFSTNRNCSTQILMEAVKPVITKKYDCEYRENSMIKAPSFLSVFFLKKSNRKTYETTFYLNVNLLTETLMRKFKPVATEMIDNEY